MGPIRGPSPCLHTVWGGTIARPAGCREFCKSQHFQPLSRHSCPRSAASCGSPTVSDDDDSFRPRPGRIRSKGAKAGQTRSFLSKVRKIARQQRRTGPRSPWRSPPVGNGERRRVRPRAARARRILRARPQPVERLSHRQPGSRADREIPVRPQAKRPPPSALHPARRYGLRRRRGRIRHLRSRRWRQLPDRGKDDRHQFGSSRQRRRRSRRPDRLHPRPDGTGRNRLARARLGRRQSHNTGHLHVHTIVNGRDALGEISSSMATISPTAYASGQANGDARTRPRHRDRAAPESSGRNRPGPAYPYDGRDRRSQSLHRPASRAGRPARPGRLTLRLPRQARQHGPPPNMHRRWGDRWNRRC